MEVTFQRYSELYSAWTVQYHTIKMRPPWGKKAWFYSILDPPAFAALVF